MYTRARARTHAHCSLSHTHTYTHIYIHTDTHTHTHNHMCMRRLSSSRAANEQQTSRYRAGIEQQSSSNRAAIEQRERATSEQRTSIAEPPAANQSILIYWMRCRCVSGVRSMPSHGLQSIIIYYGLQNTCIQKQEAVNTSKYSVNTIQLYLQSIAGMPGCRVLGVGSYAAASFCGRIGDETSTVSSALSSVKRLASSSFLPLAACTVPSSNCSPV